MLVKRRFTNGMQHSIEVEKENGNLSDAVFP
jgi:hypothetical protein